MDHVVKILCLCFYDTGYAYRSYFLYLPRPRSTSLMFIAGYAYTHLCLYMYRVFLLYIVFIYMYIIDIVHSLPALGSSFVDFSSGRSRGWYCKAVFINLFHLQQPIPASNTEVNADFPGRGRWWTTFVNNNPTASFPCTFIIYIRIHSSPKAYAMMKLSSSTSPCGNTQCLP